MKDRKELFALLVFSLLIVVVSFLFKSTVLSKIYLLPIGISISLYLLADYYLLSNISNRDKKIEMKIIFISILVIVGGFFSNVYVQNLSLKNDYLFIDMECPISLSENQEFNITVINSDLQKGTRFRLKFLGNNICNLMEEKCFEKQFLNEENFELIFAGEEKTFNLLLNKQENTKGNFHFKFYDHFGNLIYTIPKYCRYSSEGNLIN